jgi:hypothetical protein
MRHQAKYIERLGRYREAMERWDNHRKVHNCYSWSCPRAFRLWRKAQGLERKIDKMEGRV